MRSATEKLQVVQPREDVLASNNPDTVGKLTHPVARGQGD